MPTNGTNTTGDTLPSRFQYPAMPKGGKGDKGMGPGKPKPAASKPTKPKKK